jgi:ankyrin repeat protein
MFFKIDEFGNTFIHRAVIKNDLTSVRKLNLDHVNYKNLDGDTALHLACKNHNMPFAEFIYRYGGNFNIKNNENKTPLDYLNSLEMEYIKDLRDRLHGLGKYEYVPRPEPKHHGLTSSAYSGMGVK